MGFFSVGNFEGKIFSYQVIFSILTLCLLTSIDLMKSFIQLEYIVAIIVISSYDNFLLFGKKRVFSFITYTNNSNDIYI